MCTNQRMVASHKGGGAPKDAGGRYRGSRQQAELACLKRSSRRALLLGDALAFRRPTAVLARFLGLAQSGPALHGSDDMRYPGSQLLADLRRGRPGEFPNRLRAECMAPPAGPPSLPLGEYPRPKGPSQTVSEVRIIVSYLETLSIKTVQ